MSTVNSASTAFSSLINSLSNTSSSSTSSSSSSSSTSSSGTDLSLESFFKLLSAQLQNQDVSDPMDNSEMMTQITQIAMMQAMDKFTSAMEDFSQINTISYGSSMLGKDVVLAYADTDGNVQKVTGTVTKVDIYSGVPTLYLDGDEVKGYSLSSLMSLTEENDSSGTETATTGDSD